MLVESKTTANNCNQTVLWSNETVKQSQAITIKKLNFITRNSYTTYVCIILRLK